MFLYCLLFDSSRGDAALAPEMKGLTPLPCRWEGWFTWRPGLGLTSVKSVLVDVASPVTDK